MYRILGADQKEYGPAPEDVVRRWIAERRLDGRSRIRRDGEPVWRALADFPEFRAALAGERPERAAPAGSVPPSIQGARPTGPMGPTGGTGAAGPTLAGGRKASGTAIAALVAGILAPCTVGLGGAVGVVLGIVALKRIRRSQGRLGGRGMAVAGLVLSCLFLLTIPPLAFMGLMFQRQAQSFNPASDCIAHVQRLSEAVRRHANDNDDRFPAANWCDAIQSGVSGLDSFQCGSRPDLRCGYALNSAAAGKTRFELAPDTVVLFESDGGWNAVGDAASMIPASRHNGSFTVALADGTVRQISKGDISALRWNP